MISSQGGIARLATKSSPLEFSIGICHLFTWELDERGKYIPDPESLRISFRSQDASTEVSLVMKPATDHLKRSERIDSSTSGPRSWSIAESWIQRCLGSHRLCAIPNDTDEFYPSRLVCLGISSSIRLVDTTECELIRGERYITLSHCWGQMQSLRLLESNVDTLKKSIPLNALLKTYRDAIEIARRLKVRFIWIDSLCIIQDSKEDWAHQSSLMHKVYAGGLCNIAATGAEDGSKGLFFERNWQVVSSCQIHIPWMGETGADYEIEDRFWERNLIEAPLLKRAWVVQERLLSRRNLHFGKEQLLWECCELEAAERYPQGLPADQKLSALSINFKQLDPRIPRFHPSQTNEDQTRWAYNAWNKIIREYSSAALSNPDDKLVALSGIALQFQSIIGGEYVAGTWRHNLICGLLWSSSSSIPWESPCVRPKQYRAPSFSWASLDGKICPNDHIRSGIIATVLECSISLRHDNLKTGVVIGGHLTLRGLMRCVQLSQNATTFPQAVITSMDGLNMPPFKWPTVLLDVIDEDISQLVYIVMLCDQVKSNTVSKESEACGIVLRYLAGTKGKYQRIGCLYGRIQNDIDLFIYGNSEGLKKPCGPCLEYDAETGHHTICVI